MVLPTFKTPFIIILLVSLQWIQVSFALVRGDSQCKYSICVSATLDQDTVTYELTSLKKSIGWIALGFGPHMSHTHSVIMWHNQDGTTTLSHRYASGYTEPKLEDAPPRVATIVQPSTLVNRPADSATYAFQIPANNSLLQSNNPSESLIFAYSNFLPDKSPDANLRKHKRVGHLTLDLTKEFVSPVFPILDTPSIKPTATRSTSNEIFIIYHAFFVSLGFLVLLPAGSLIGRWARGFTPKWFKIHRLVNMSFALPIITLGVLLGPVVVITKPTFRTHFANAHEICGGILLLLYYAQVLLGRYIHERRNKLAAIGPITRPHPPLNILHICLGISIIGLAFFQVRSGLQWWETLTGRPPMPLSYPLWHVWIVLLPLVYFGGYVLLPRQLNLEREASYVPLPAEGNQQSEEGES